MAKNTTSTKDKTKTSKRTSAAAKTAADKTVKKTVKAPVAKKTDVPAKKATVVTTDSKATEAVKRPRVSISRAATTSAGLRKFNLFAAVVLAAAAGAAGSLMKLDSYTLGVGHATKDALLSVDRTVFAPAQTSMFDLRVVWVLAGIMAIAALLALLRATKLRAYERRGLDKGVMTWRWIDLGITGALMLELVALLSGMNDLASLNMVGLFVGLAAVLAWMAERANAAKSSSKAEFVVASIAGLIPFLAVAGYLLDTSFYGMIRLPWFIYAAYATLLIGYGLIARQLALVLKGKATVYLTAERNYARLGLLTKVAFAVIIIVGLMQ